MKLGDRLRAWYRRAPAEDYPIDSELKNKASEQKREAEKADDVNPLSIRAQTGVARPAERSTAAKKKV